MNHDAFEFKEDIQRSCEKLYKKLLNDYAGGNFDDVIFDIDDISRVCSILLHYSSPEFKKQEIAHLLFSAFGIEE